MATACARPQNFDNFEYDDDDDDNAGNFNADVVRKLAEQDLYDVSKINNDPEVNTKLKTLLSVLICLTLLIFLLS